jgi:hypothetical protein
MPWYLITIIILYALLIIAYSVLKARRLKNLRIPVKSSLVALFLAVGVIGMAENSAAVNILLFVALIFSGIGDILLLFMNKGREYFHAGVVAFGISNILIIISAVLRFEFVWYSLVIFGIIFIGNLVLQLIGFIDYGKSKIFLNIYLPIVCYSGCLGFTIALSGFGLAGVLFGIGALMFFISDICLGIFQFKVKKWQIDSLNSLLYFSGVMSIALSMFF